MYYEIKFISSICLKLVCFRDKSCKSQVLFISVANLLCLAPTDVLLIYLVFYINRLGTGPSDVCLYRPRSYVGIYTPYLHNRPKLADILLFNFFSLLICRFSFPEKSSGYLSNSSISGQTDTGNKLLHVIVHACTPLVGRIWVRLPEAVNLYLYHYFNISSNADSGILKLYIYIFFFVLTM